MTTTPVANVRLDPRTRWSPQWPGGSTGSPLVAAGAGRRAIERRIEWGLLHTVHRGVYALGHRTLRREAWWMAAVLAAGEGAVLSYRSAAVLWGMRETGRARIQVSVPRHRRSTAHIEVHHVAMAPDEVTTHRAIPVTTPARTLLDLAAVLAEDQLEHAFNEAEFRRLTSPTVLDVLLARYSARKGTTSLRGVLESHRRNGETVTRSRLERRLLALVDRHNLPRPRINRVGPEGELDATWPQERLVVECDGFAAHGTRKAFEEDRARDRRFRSLGGASSGSPGGSSPTTRTSSRGSSPRCSTARPSGGASGATTAGRRRGSGRRARAGGDASLRRSRWGLRGRRWSW